TAAHTATYTLSLHDALPISRQDKSPVQRRFDWPAFLEMRKRARQSTSDRTYTAATHSTPGTASPPHSAAPLHPTATPFRFPIRFRALSACGHRHSLGDPEQVAFHLSLLASHPRGNRNVYAAAHSFVSFTHRPNHRQRF